MPALEFTLPDLAVLPPVSTPALPSASVHATKNTAQEIEVARQFEALLLQQWLKQARQSTGQDTLFDSDQTRFAQTWSDEQLAQHLSTPGIGLAQALLEQMAQTRGQGRPQMP